MHVLELGRLDGEVLLFGGPYSNLQATQALLDLGGRRHLICTGDVVAYCADPVATIDLVRASHAQVVAGNCERQLADDAPHCGCGFEVGSRCDVLSSGWYPYARARMSGAAREWMAGLPDIATFWHAGFRVAVIHGGVPDIARFVWSNASEVVLQEEWRAIEAHIGAVDIVVAGHSGQAFQRKLPRGLWVNAGVIGMPPNDGSKQTEYALLQDGRVSFHRLDYDVQSAHTRMVDAGLTQGYHSALLNGYWPSEDVLPPDLRRSTFVASG